MTDLFLLKKVISV